MNEGTKVNEFTREEIRKIAEETLRAIGVEPVELDYGERYVIRRAVEEWRMRKGKRKEGL